MTRFPNTPLGRAMNGTTAVAKKPVGLELRAVAQVPVHELQPNPLSSTYFNDLTIGELEKLTEDIRKRGILVPLIARLDKVLLSGHNRLQAAKELGLTHVPVQFVVAPLTEEQEREFVVKDNLLRRQLSNDERISLYRVLYPNFEERLAPRGAVQASQKHEVLTVKQIAADTGQKPSAVQKQINRHFTKENRASQRELDPKEIEKAKERSVMGAARASMERVQEDVKAFSPQFQAKVARLLIDAGEKMLQYAEKQKR